MLVAYLIFMPNVVGINLYFISNHVLIKFDQLKCWMLKAQSTIKPLHSFFPLTCWVRQVVTLAMNNVAQKEEAVVKSLWRCASARCTQPPVDCLWCLEHSFPGLSVISDNLCFSYVILFLYTIICHYMHETWSWHAYGYALGFLWKSGCDNMHMPCPPWERRERIEGEKREEKGREK
jgi:hypothetical protein